ncbi:MAG: hypothetical protein EOO78_10655 [Oxalobacteraceae bacterium]|nr:MAG: hypothetical protein EOO78_10655 [Oxalobacteraceae bacterium]
MMPGAGRDGVGTPAWVAVPLAIGAVLLILLTCPVSLSLIALAHALDNRRLRAVASRTRCVRCGEALGYASLDAADAAWATEMAEVQRRRSPGVRMRVVRHCRALCATCGMKYGWNDRDRTLQPLLPEDLGCEDARSEPANPASRTGPSAGTDGPS